MDSGVSRRVLHGLGANAYNQLVVVAIQLAGVPILLYAWGPHLYGEWLILFAIPAYLSISNLGLSLSAGNDMTARVHRGDYEGALAVYQSLASLMGLLSLGGLLSSAVVVSQLPLRNWIDFDEIRDGLELWVLWLLIAEIFVRLIYEVTRSGYRACGDYALFVGLDATVRLVQFSIVWIVALSGGGPLGAAAGYLCVRILVTPLSLLLLRARHSWLRLGLEHAHVSWLSPLIKPSLANLAMPLGMAIYIQGFVIAIGAVLGPIAVVAFSSLRTLTRFVVQLVMAVNHTVEPELAGAWGTENRLLVRSLYVHSVRGSLWLALMSSVGLAVFGSFVLEVWTHGRVAMERELFALLLISTMCSAAWHSAFVVLRAANRHVYVAWMQVVSSAVAVAAAVALLQWTNDLASAGIPILLMEIALSYFTLRSLSDFLKCSLASEYREAVNPIPLIDYLLRRLKPT